MILEILSTNRDLQEIVKEEGMLRTMTYKDLPSYNAGMEKRALEDAIIMIEKFNIKIEDVARELKVPIEEIKKRLKPKNKCL